VRLDLALIRRHPELSRRKARDVIEKGQVDVSGACVREPGQEVEDGAAVTWDPNRKARTVVRSPLPLLYEDERLLVVDKPAGLLSVPTSPEARDQEDTAFARVTAYTKRLRPRRPYAGIVHRIDRDTSGALAFALDPAMREALRALFRTHRIERRYWALVAGSLRQDQGTIRRAIGDAYRDGKRRIAQEEEASREGVTHYRLVERLGTASLVELRLETGLQHQIRIHLADLGHPVLGDRAYGADAQRGPRTASRQMLHAKVLAFAHPETGETVQAESPLPADFDRLLRDLKKRGR
jgi:23S rRNA pseudouridine1911/1915/1917 synthase